MKHLQVKFYLQVYDRDREKFCEIILNSQKYVPIMISILEFSVLSFLNKVEDLHENEFSERESKSLITIQEFK